MFFLLCLDSQQAAYLSFGSSKGTKGNKAIIKYSCIVVTSQIFHYFKIGKYDLFMYLSVHSNVGNNKFL
jgi:hypothetical protein